jgi:hypothetical protein
MGKRGREYVVLGHARWVADRRRLADFLTTSKSRLTDEHFSYASAHHLPLPEVSVSPASRPVAARSGGKRLRGEAKRGTSEFPLISVVTVVLNARDEIEETIQSVLEQDYPNLEYVVLDGESTDGTLQVVEAFDRISTTGRAPRTTACTTP